MVCSETKLPKETTMPFILENIVVPAAVGFTVGVMHRMVKNRTAPTSK